MSPADADREEVNHLLAGLMSDAPDTERRFSADMRRAVPPPALRAFWRSLLARHGALRHFGIVHTDSEYGKRRYTLELDFSERKRLGLVVFEPATGEIIGFFVRPAPGSVPPAAPEATADPDVSEIELSIGAPPNVLGATLTLPRRRGDARLPGVLMIPGSGPTDRDETAQRAKPFRDIAHALARRNIVTLRFDKRPHTYPEHCDGPGYTIDDEVISDAVLALGVLRTQPEVEPARVFVLGHSQGAFVAPEVAARGGNVAGLVLIAAPTAPLLENLIAQFRVRGRPASELAALVKQAKTLASLPPDEPVFGMRASYWQDLDRRDEPATARRLGVKVLYLRGAVDRNVFADDQEKWSRAFAGDPRFEQVTLPGLGHMLVPASADLSQDAHVPDALTTKISDFVAAPSG